MGYKKSLKEIIIHSSNNISKQKKIEQYLNHSMYGVMSTRVDTLYNSFVLCFKISKDYFLSPGLDKLYPPIREELTGHLLEGMQLHSTTEKQFLLKRLNFKMDKGKGKLSIDWEADKKNKTVQFETSISDPLYRAFLHVFTPIYFEKHEEFQSLCKTGDIKKLGKMFTVIKLLNRLLMECHRLVGYQGVRRNSASLPISVNSVEYNLPRYIHKIADIEKAYSEAKFKTPQQIKPKNEIAHILQESISKEGSAMKNKESKPKLVRIDEQSQVNTEHTIEANINDYKDFLNKVLKDE